MKNFFRRLLESFKRHPKRYIYTTLMVILAVVFLCSAGSVTTYYVENYQQAKLNEKLVDIVEQAKQEVIDKGGVVIEQKPDGTLNIDPQNPLLNDKNLYAEVPNDEGVKVKVLKEYAGIYGLNNDTVGWIKIPGTKVNYPVLQKKGVKNYYLKRDFYEKDARHGTVYAHEEATFPNTTGVTTLFGHNMGDGSMFAGLHAYRKEEFYKAHPYIFFDTLTHHQIYKIIAVFETTTDPTTGFDYHDFVNPDEHEFGMYMEQCKALSMYKIDDTAVYGNELLALSTCDDDVTDDTVRFVVVAKKVSL